MQDYPIQIPLGGLAVKEDGPGTLQSINLRPYGKGLRSILAPKALYDLQAEWPFPQLLRLGGNVFATTKDAIYRVNSGLLQPLLGDIPNAGYPWSGAIVGDYLVFVNNKVVVTGRSTLAIDTSGKIPTGIAICTVAGSQLVIAAPWAYGEWHYHSVIWSRVGSVDFIVDKSNVSAVRHAQCGQVLSVKPFYKKTLTGLKFSFMAFGTDGVSSFMAADLPAVFSTKKISDVGIYSQLAVSGEDDLIYYVGTNGVLFSATDGDIKEVGYKRSFGAARGELVLSYNALDKELWVGM